MVVVDDNNVIEKGCKDVIVLVLPNKPEYVSVARLTVSGIASRMGFDIEAIEDIKLAVAEACTNAIKYGCPQHLSEYKVEFTIEEGCLSISVIDKGCGFEKNSIRNPNPDNLKEGGLGLFIINTLMDEVAVERIPNSGFTLTMRKYLGV